MEDICFMNRHEESSDSLENPVAIKNKSIPFVSVPAYISTLVVKSLHSTSGDVSVCQ
jgi:hypothetical protein